MALYTVTFVATNGDEIVSRFFSTIRAARSYARWLCERSYTQSVKLYRGSAGAELIETRTRLTLS